MFNLIVTVLAVIVMIAVAVAGLSYLGPAFTTASTRAAVAQVMNASAQIEGAQSLRRAENGGEGTVDATPGSAVASLVSDGYLKTVPAVPPSTTAAGETWHVVADPSDATRTLVVLKLDESKPGTAALCAGLAAAMPGHAGCTSDPSTLQAQ